MTSTQTQTQTQTLGIELHEAPFSERTAAPILPSSTVAPPQSGRVFDVDPYSSLRPWMRLLIVSLIALSNLLQFNVMFVTFMGAFTLSKALGRDATPNQANWMAAAYSLTQGAFVLISGRLGAVYGHQRVLIVGGAILVVFTLATALCTSYPAFVGMRALTGVGGGLMMPNAVAIITIMLPPGRSRNITMGFFAASAPVGGWTGALLVGLFTELSRWQYLFVFLGALTGVLFVGLFLLLPQEQPLDKHGKIDFIGAFLGLGSLLLFNFAWNQAPSVGWSTPYEIASVILSVVMFAAFFVWEKGYAREPIMPVSVFGAPTFTALVFVVLLAYMSFGTSLWYMLAWQQLVRGMTVLEVTVAWSPFGVLAVAAVFSVAWLIPRLAAQYIMAVGVGCVLLANVLLATMPAQQSYWAQTFPAVVLSSICPDFVYVAAQIIASNSVSRRHQGVAGSLIGTLNLYGNSLGLGFAGTVETAVGAYPGADEVSGYRAALWFGVALAAAGLLLDFAWVRMPKDDREGWDPELEGAPAEALAVGATVSGAATGVESASLPQTMA